MKSEVILDVKEKITPDLIKNLIENHKENERVQLKSLHNFYTNTQINEFPSYIINRTLDYFSRTPITYSSTNTLLLNFLEKIYSKNNEENHNNELIKDMFIYGTAYELLYFNKNNEITLCKLPVENVISIYDKNHNIIAIIIYAINETNEKERIYIEVYKNDLIQFYLLEKDEISLINQRENKLNCIPINTYLNEFNGYGDFEKVLPYIEQYLKTSNTLSDLSKLKREIHRVSGVPNEELKYFQESSSKIPKKIKYKFLDLEDKCRKKERWLKQALYNRIRLIVTISNLNPNTYDERDIKIILNEK